MYFLIAQDPEHSEYSQYFKFLLPHFSFHPEPSWFWFCYTSISVLLLSLWRILACSSIILCLFTTRNSIWSGDQDVEVHCKKFYQLYFLLCLLPLLFFFFPLSFLLFYISLLPIIFLLVLSRQLYASLLNPPWVSTIEQLKFVLSYFLFRLNLLQISSNYISLLGSICYRCYFNFFSMIIWVTWFLPFASETSRDKECVRVGSHCSSYI